MSQDSSVGIATGYELNDLMIGVRFSAGAVNFSRRYRVHTGSGAHPASYAMGLRGLSLGIKRPGREADHRPLSTAEVKNPFTTTTTVELHLRFANTPSWCSVKNTGTTLHYIIYNILV
jgi:hypothetical protein